MPNKFNWQTEDDFNWDQLPPEAEERPSGSTRRWPMLLLVLVLVTAAGGVLYRQVQQRAAENTAAMRADIISSHNLLQFADDERDEELFLSLLSGRDSDWVAAQQALFKNGLLRDRGTFDLTAQPAPPQTNDGENMEITFAPDLLTAELTAAVPYEVSIGNGLTETVTLQETAVYRLGRERWLLSPPDSGFWGPQVSRQGAGLKLTYPQRDTAVADRLLPDLGRKLGELCSRLADVECPPDLQIEVQLSSDPGTLADTVRLPTALVLPTPATLQVTLPAPTLIGLPQDEGAYEALFRGYAAHMSTAIIANLVGYECCAKASFFQALVDYQLNQLNLRPWPVGEQEYARILDEQVRILDIATQWSGSDLADLLGPEEWRVYTAVDYLLSTNPDLSAAKLQRELTRQETFFGWLNTLFAGGDENASLTFYGSLMRDWWMRGYTATQTGDALATAQDIYLTCVVQSELDEDVQIATLYRTDPQQQAWEELYNTSSYLLVSPLPGDETLLQQEFRFDEQRWVTQIRRSGELVPLQTHPADYTISFGQTDPVGQALAALTFVSEGSNVPSVISFNLGDCTPEGCSSEAVPGLPIWSPDGEQALFTSNPDMQLGLLQTELRTVLFDERARTPGLDLYVAKRAEFMDGNQAVNVTDLRQVGHGHAPFWLDEATIGYLTRSQNGFSRTDRIMTASVGADGTPQTLLTVDDLLTALGEGDDNKDYWWIDYVMVHPQSPDVLYVAAFQSDEIVAHIFAYDRAQETISHLMEAGYTANHSLGISPDGRYLVLTGISSSDGTALIQVHDLLNQETLPFISIPADFPPFSTYDWSEDGRWLALMLEENLVGLYAPDENHLRFLETPAGVCAAPAWIDR
jgi:hypothetical protein